MTTKTRLMKSIFCFATIITMSFNATASFAQTSTKGASGLPIPRFVSLKAKRVNMRVGPGQSYKVSWLYTKSAIPMEIIQEYDNWRRVRDFEGTEGWVFHSLLSGDRSAVAAPWMRGKTPLSYINIHNEATKNSGISAKLEPGVIAKISQCNGDWCEVRIDNIKGWASQEELWGVYPKEAFN